MITKVMKLKMSTLQEALEDSGGNKHFLEELLRKFRLWLTQQIHLSQGLYFKFRSIISIDTL